MLCLGPHPPTPHPHLLTPRGRLARGSSPAVWRGAQWSRLGLLEQSPHWVLTSRNRCPALCLSLCWQPVTKEPKASFQQLQPSAAPFKQRGSAWPPPCAFPRLPSSPLPPPASPHASPPGCQRQRVPLRRAQLGHQAGEGEGLRRAQPGLGGREWGGRRNRLYRALKLLGQPEENSSGFQFTWEPAERRVDSRGNELSCFERMRL